MAKVNVSLELSDEELSCINSIKLVFDKSKVTRQVVKADKKIEKKIVEEKNIIEGIESSMLRDI